MTPKVAFALTVYNKEAWIAQTLYTIQKQTLKDIEIIVWNDGCTDSTMKIVELAAAKDPRIKIGGGIHNWGCSKAWNSARHLITAPYVCIASGDDLYDFKRAQITKDYFDKHPHIQCMYGSFVRIDAKGKILEVKKALPFNREAIFLPNNQYIPHGFMSVRWEVLRDVPYDETLKYGIDYPWIKELCQQGYSFGKTKANLGCYRWIPSNVSHQHRAEIYAQDNPLFLREQ